MKMLLITLLLATTVWSGSSSGDLARKLPNLSELTDLGNLPGTKAEAEAGERTERPTQTAGTKGMLSELLGQEEARTLEKDLLGRNGQEWERHASNDSIVSEGSYEVKDAGDYGVILRTENGVSWIQMKGLHGARLLKDGKLLAGDFNTSVYFAISDSTRIFYSDRKQTDLDPVTGFDYICLSPVTAGGPMILLPNPFGGKDGEV